MENVCRTCLRVLDNLSSLYNTHLIYKIEAIAAVQIILTNDYPTNICKECISNINKLYNFRKVIINSEKELRERQETIQRIRTKLSPEDPVSEPSIKYEETETTLFDSVDSTQYSPSESDHDSTASLSDSRHKITPTFKPNNLKLHESKCNICEKTFSSRYKLSNHRRTEHTSPGVCSVCGMIIRSDNLKRHVQMHMEPPVECKICGKTFKNSESLRGHSLIHKGTVFTCEVCGKSFKVKAEYKRHMKIHIDPEVGKVMCSICGKKVRDIKKHINSHTGERPYLCVHCNRGFCSTYSLKVHSRQHTNEKPYQCELCPMAFPQKVSLSTHLRSKHNQNKDPLDD